MSIANHIEKIKERLQRGEFTSEAVVSQGIVLPTLHQLGWPVFETSIVFPEYSLEGRRVDYALCHPASRPSIFIEVKKVGFSGGADKQLFEYAFHQGVPMAILTDGQEWSFYLPGEQGKYDERRVYKLDLLERNTDETVNRLERYLKYEKVCSGEALKAARTDYQNVSRNREIDAVLPKAWNALLEEPDSLILELLAEKAEDLCGYKPDLDVCSKFVTQSLKHSNTIATFPSQDLQPRTSKILESASPLQTNRTRTTGNFSFVFEGIRYEAASAKDITVQLFRLLANADSDFLTKFSARKHGTTRRFIAQKKEELYRDRPDLVRNHSVEFFPGWWIGTNYSQAEYRDKILKLACEVLHPSLRSSLNKILEDDNLWKN